MAYIVPKVLIQQEFTQVPVYREFPMAAFIIGPQYALFRYDVEDEKEFTKVMHPTDEALGNKYQKNEDVIYSFPNVPAGGKVDHRYTKVIFENTAAQYFPNADLGTEDLQEGADDTVLVETGRARDRKVEFTGAIVGTTLTVSSVTSGSLGLNLILTGANILEGTKVTAYGTGVGATGTYTVNISQNVTSTTIAGSRPVYYSNRIRFPQHLTDGHGYERSPWFSNRDVRKGDMVRLTDENGLSLTSFIKDVLPETPIQNADLASKVGPAAAIKSSTINPDGQVYANSNRFTADSGAFTKDLEGEFITVEGEINQTFKILAVVSESELLLDEAAVEDESGLAWRIGGQWNDINNAEPQNYSVSVAFESDIEGQVQGDWTASVVDAQDTSTYIGHKHLRIIQDVYTAELTHYNAALATEAERLASARFTIYSNSGAFAPKQYRMLDSNNILTVDNARGNNLKLDFTGADDWAVGKSIKVFAKAQVESAGVTATAPGVLGYTGTADIVYKVTVIRGGAFLKSDRSNADTAARVAVTSSGVDSSGSVLVEKDMAFPIGSYGVFATFTAGSVGAGDDEGLVAGDVFYIGAKAARLGPYTIIELNDALPAPFLYVDEYPNLNVELFAMIPKAEIPSLRDLVEGTANWVQVENYITVNSAATTYLPSLVIGDTPARLPIEQAKVFVQHRDLLQDNVVSIGSVRSGGQIERTLGLIHPDNPLAQGVNDAVLNANGAVVYYIGVESDDLAGYLAAIEIAKKSDKVYSFAPMTFDRAIQDAVVSHVNAYSTPEVGRWRIAWLSCQDKKTKALYDLKENGSPWVGTITDDLQVPGSQNRLVTMQGASFIDDGIRANDSVRFNFRLNADGQITYDELFVDEVRTQTTLALTTSIPSPLNAPVKMEIVRHFTRDERASNLSLIGGEYNNRRVRVVFPDEYKYEAGDGTMVTKQGYFMAAALAGLRSGVVPHQGLTNTQVLGASDLSKVVSEFTQDQLNVMAEQGIWIVTQEIVGATPYARHQLTTDERSLNTSEDSITTNVDNISYALKHTLEPYIGTYNVNPENLLVIRDAIIGELTFRATSTRTVRAGNQLTSFSAEDDILLLQQNPTYKDRIDVEVKLNVPYPLNYINLKLIV